MYLYQGKKISIDSSITVAGITYPNLRSQATREALGIIEVPDPVYPDPELYFWSENEDGSLTITEKPAEMVAQAKQAKTNLTAALYLSSTDWMVTRFAETGVPIPDDIKLARQAARDSIVKEVRDASDLPLPQ